MSFIGGMLGGSGGQGGAFNAASPQNSSIVSPTDIRQFQGNLTSGLGQQQNLYDQLAAQNGVQNQGNVFQQQQQLAQQLQAQTQGQGPNPAQAALAQATGANTSNQAALMAGQRGAGANAGLIARQAAMQGGANQQGAVGQSATMQAQQQLAAQQQLQQQQASMANVAGQQVGQQQQQGNAYTQNALGATTGFLNAATGLQSNANNVNGSMAAQNAKGQYGLLSGIGTALAMAQGGQVPSYAIGGDVQGGQGGSMLASFMNGQIGSFQNPGDNASMGMPKKSKEKDPTGATTTTPTQITDTSNPTQTLDIGSLDMKSKGGHVGGQAKVKGDSYKNDNVPALLSPGEVVIPRRIMQGPDAANKSAQFVAAILAKNGRAK